MRSKGTADPPMTPERLREYLADVLAAIAVVGAVLPWVVLVEAWQVVGADEYAGMDAGIRLTLAAQALPYVSLQAGQYEVLAMAAVVGAILLGRHRPGESPEGMRWSRAPVVTGVAVVVALAAAVVRLVVALAGLTGVLGGEWADQYMAPPSGTVAALVILGSAIGVLGWVAVVLIGLVFRPDPTVVEGPTDDGEDTPPSDERLATSDEVPRPPLPQLSPADIRPDGASDSGYDEFRFRR